MFTACNDDKFCTSGNGEIKTETRSLNEFTRVITEIPMDIYLSNGDHSEVRIEASSNLIHLIKTRTSGSTLTIDTDDNQCIRNNHPIRVYVTSPTITSLDIRGSGDAYDQGTLVANRFEATIQGSGSIELNELDVQDFDVHISGSGDIILSGSTCNNGSIQIDGSGNVNTYGMVTDNVDVDISGSGDAFVHAMDFLNVEISGSGNVYYRGTPSIRSKVSGSGNIVKD